MCLFSTRSKWEEEVVFANRPSKRRSRVVEETVVRRSNSRPAQYVEAPRVSTPIIRAATPPAVRAPTVPPAPPRIELVEVEEVEERRSSPRASKASVSVSNANTKRSRKSSRGGEEVYIERERVREWIDPGLDPRRSVEMAPAYRYLEGTAQPRASERYIEEDGRRRSRSITYETNPRASARTVARERVVVEDGGRRREYYRRP